MNIRDITPADAPAVLRIYKPYVEQTAITFEIEVPTLDEFSQRIADISARYPYIVAEDADGTIVGYAYASTFKARAAYRFCVETSIYVDTQRRHTGIGSLLHDALEQRLRQQGVLNMNACISFIETDDPYLPLDSVGFHHHKGYTRVAHFHQCGLKFGRWYDMIWMEKIIGPHPLQPENHD